MISDGQESNKGGAQSAKKDEKEAQKRKEVEARIREAVARSHATRSSNTEDRLVKLKEQGIINEQQLARIKKDLLM
jgi:hypothetical protein